MALPQPLPRSAIPEWLHLLPAGQARTIDGRGPYIIPDADKLVTASMAGGKLVLDENHATDLAAPKGGAAPARGWIVELDARADGIWGRVEWTGEGRRIMADRAYRGVSPVIAHDAGGSVSHILRASLTNTPNLLGLQSLHSSAPGLLHDKIQAFRAEIARVRADVDEVAVSMGLRSSKPAIASDPRNLAAEAALYQVELRRAGRQITLAEAVRVVLARDQDSVRLSMNHQRAQAGASAQRLAGDAAIYQSNAIASGTRMTIAEAVRHVSRRA